MQKIGLILLLILINCSCSIIRKGGNTDYGSINRDRAEKRIKRLEEQNITKYNFFIQKAEVEITSPNYKKSLIGSLKYEKPDKFLITIKSKAGIEAARIYISFDTILINDRINKRLLYGSRDYLKNRYGIYNNLFAIALGDFISDNAFEIDSNKCLNGRLVLIGEARGLKINYIVDCKRNKIVYASNERVLNGDQIEIEIDSYRRLGNILIADKIEIRDINSMTDVVIRIKKIDLTWKGKIEFIPGSRYEIRKLL